jgi:HSP20 family molecular chaperone IbpA
MLYLDSWRWFDDVLDRLDLYPLTPNRLSCLEKDGVLTWRVGLPGVKREDLTVEVVENNQLLVTGKREGRQTIQELIPVARGYKAEKVDATLANGELTLTFKAVEKKLIEVK